MLASRRMSAYLSEPTQPMKRTEEGGRMYCFCRETKKKGFGKCAESDLSEFGFLIEKKEWETGGGVCVYLSTTSGVLGGSTGNQFGIVVVEEFFVEAHVLLLCENGIIGLEPIFLE